MLDHYAEMLVRDAISLRSGQDLFLCGPAPLHDFALRVGEAAYKAGARSVQYRFPDPDEIVQMLRVGGAEQITIYHEAIQEFYAEIIKRGAASIALVSHMNNAPWFEESKERYPGLNALEIRELHITGGGNDLRLSLSDRARWTDASFETKNGQVSCSNFPSDEIFTVPDYRVTNGVLVASKPLRLFNRSFVEGLSLVFRDGRLVDFDAETGKGAFSEWIAIDAGASMLGEIGLVGSDAPLYAMDRYFDFPGLVENTASHIAIGHGLSFTLRDAGRLTDADLSSVGCNVSSIHTDICFGSPDVSIVATQTGRGEIVLLDGGEWGL